VAKKRAKKMATTVEPRRVRLDLSPDVYDCLERAARHKGLSLASYARMAVTERSREDDPEIPKNPRDIR
jgi:uncharacterized protein (DUF1778 family)